jgi:hypothetical protein
LSFRTENPPRSTSSAPSPALSQPGDETDADRPAEGIEIGILTKGKATLGMVLVSLLLQEAVKVRIRLVDTSERPVINRDDVTFALRLAADRGIECNYEFAGPSERAFSAGRARLISALGGRNLCLVDDDVVLPSQALARLLDTARLGGVFGYISPVCTNSPTVAGSWGSQPPCTPGSLIYQDETVHRILLAYYRATTDVLDRAPGGKVWEQAFLTSLFEALGRPCARLDDVVIHHLDYGEGPRWIDEERTVIARSRRVAEDLVHKARIGQLGTAADPAPPIRPRPNVAAVRLRLTPMQRLRRVFQIGR